VVQRVANLESPPTLSRSASLAAMDDSALEKVGQLVGLNLYERSWTGTAVILALREDLASVHAAVAERWRSLLAGMSSGIAHADYNDPATEDLERAYSEYGRVAIVAPQAVVPNAARQVLFVGIEDAGPLPENVSVAYAVTPLTDTWRKSLGSVTIVDVLRD